MYFNQNIIQEKQGKQFAFVYNTALQITCRTLLTYRIKQKVLNKKKLLLIQLLLT